MREYWRSIRIPFSLVSNPFLHTAMLARIISPYAWDVKEEHASPVEMERRRVTILARRAEFFGYGANRRHGKTARESHVIAFSMLQTKTFTIQHMERRGEKQRCCKSQGKKSTLRSATRSRSDLITQLHDPHLRIGLSSPIQWSNLGSCILYKQHPSSLL